MNDTELSTAVRESVADIRSATPVAQIIGRGRAVRVRRRIPAAAGALTVAAVTALAVTALLPSGHPAPRPSSQPAAGSHPAGVRLAAWTVTRQANGDIDVTVNQLKNPAGLQATLRADGLPVTVSFSGPPLATYCQPYQTTRDTLRAVAQFQASYLVIDPSALPSGTGVAIFDEPGAGLPSPSADTPTHGPASGRPIVGPLISGLDGPLAVGLVYASAQCTG